jgi:hypothetical protein
LSRGLRTTVKTPAQMVRRAMACLKAQRTLLLEARQHEKGPSELFRRLSEQVQHLNAQLRELAGIAADLDLAAFERRRARAAEPVQRKRAA